MDHFWNKGKFGDILHYIQTAAVLVLNMWDFLRLSCLFDAVQPLDDSCVALHSRDAVRDALPCLLLLILLSVRQSVVGRPPRLVTVRGDHGGWSEIQANNVRVGPRKVLWANCLELFRVKATVVKKAFHISSSPGVPIRQVWFRAV